jgi:hypothetical protein
MPYKVRRGKGERKWKIVNTDTKEVVGSSLTKKEAEASIRARYAHER